MTSTLLQQAVEAARVAFEADAERSYPDIHLRATRTDNGYINPLWDGDWQLWKRAWLSALQQQPEPVAPSDEEIVAWVDSFIRKQAYNYPVAVQIATEAAKWVRGRSAPPALQQQEEPREVAKWQEKAMDLAFQWAHAAYCKGLGRPHSDIEPIRAQLRAHLAASPSPQDFTLPMVEEGKGTDGVKGLDDAQR